MHLKQGACPRESKGRLLMPKGRALRIGFVFAGLLMMVPYVAGQHNSDTRSVYQPRLQTSKSFYVEQVAVSQATLSEQGGSGGARTAQNAGSCTFESTHTDADFEGPGLFSILFGFAQAEIAAASYVIDPALFPISVERVEMVFAQTGLEDKTTVLKLLIFKGTPNQGQLVQEIEHTLDFPNCGDGLFCNGIEICADGGCASVAPPCPGQLCNEANDTCVECLSGADCDDGLFCNGVELCQGGACVAGLEECSAGQLCDEAGQQCIVVACSVDGDCDDGEFCNGPEVCVAKFCEAGVPPCDAGEQCDSSSSDCVECLSDNDCDDGLACSGTETCVGGSCMPGSLLCPDQLCDEGGPSCFDRSCDAVNVVFDGLNAIVENNGSDTFSVGLQIVSHNDPSDNPCLANPPPDNNVFPTVDVSGVSDDQNNWMNVINCGPLDCPPGWRTFDGLALCEPDGDWVLRACWSPKATPLFGACCFDDGTCQEDMANVTCEANEGAFQGEDSICEPGLCDPIGACCLEDEDDIACFPLSEAICMVAQGTWAGVGTDCPDLDGDGVPDICEPQLGACCLPSGICQNLTLQEDCEAQGGFYNGENSLCSQTVCQGACCLGQTCLGDSTLEDCFFDWRGPITSCDDEVNPCLDPTPTGACCSADGMSCTEVLEDACDAAGGSWFGPGSNCSIMCDEPPVATGACCLPTGQCQIISEVDCTGLGGTYQGDASNCTACQTQACCFEGAGCLDLPEAICDAAGGNAQGAGTTCATVICPQPEGACCFDTGLCLDLTFSECAAGGAVWQGDETSCADDPGPCGGPTGACCRNSGGCLDGQSEASCAAQPGGGTYQGDFSECASAECASATGACCRFNGDCTLDQTIEECAAVEGDFLGEGSDCSTCVTEACCLDGGGCQDLLALPCQDIVLGDPQGPGTECANTECPKEGTGACCETDGTCTVVLEADCIAGTYQGDGSSCELAECCQGNSDCDDNDVCNGLETCTDNSCAAGSPLNCDDDSECTDDDCDPVGGCSNVTIDCDDGDDCTTNDCDPGTGCFNDLIEPCCGNGILEPAAGEECDPPDGVICDENCQFLPTGACCLITGACTDDVSDNACTNVGGTWQGPGVMCEAGLCAGCTQGDGAADNDCCAEMIPIATGSTAFDTNNANTDGPAHDECLFFGQNQTHHDIWYDYIAGCSGSVTVTTCEDLGGSADYDTKLVVYDGCDCDALTLIDCNDDDPDHPCGDMPDFHSTVTFSAVAGNCYLVRIGSFSSSETGEGTGSLFIECGVSCPADINGDGLVNPIDLASLLGAWGPCSEPCTPGDPADTCAADFSGDCDVAPLDLATLLGAWGPCG